MSDGVVDCPKIAFESKLTAITIPYRKLVVRMTEKSMESQIYRIKPNFSLIVKKQSTFGINIAMCKDRHSRDHW